MSWVALGNQRVVPRRADNNAFQPLGGSNGPVRQLQLKRRHSLDTIKIQDEEGVGARHEPLMLERRKEAHVKDVLDEVRLLRLAVLHEAGLVRCPAFISSVLVHRRAFMAAARSRRREMCAASAFAASAPAPVASASLTSGAVVPSPPDVVAAVAAGRC